MVRVSNWIGALLFGAMGLVLSIGGGRLAALGGSLYYVGAGFSLLLVCVLLARRNRWAAWIYYALTLATIIWALDETGFDAWALLPRVAVLGTLGLWFAIPAVRNGWVTGAGVSDGSRRLLGTAGPILFIASGLLVIGSYIHGSFSPLAPSTSAAPPATRLSRGNDWPLYGNTLRGDRFSPADRITPANAGGLSLAWTFRTGDKLLPTDPVGTETSFEATPIKVGNSLFFCSPHNVLFSLDADTGKELWRFDPHVDTTGASYLVCRGVSYYPGEGTHEFCDGRILMATIDNHLRAVDVATGKPCPDFGSNGVVDLAIGMGHNVPGYHYPTSPPMIVGRAAVLGTFHSDNQSNDEPSGVVRAFDTRTGALLWAWDALEPLSHPPLGPGESYTRNTANAWTIFSADTDLGLIFIPTGGPPPDFFGGQRTEAQDRYNDSIVALDVKTGNVRWSFQTSHHDLWDLDNGAQPVVVDLDLRTGRTPVLIAPTKRGDIFVLDRRTGKPVFKVEERPVPQSPAPGERLSPTQPYQVGFPTFSPPRLAETDMWGATMFDQLLCRIEFRRQRYEGAFTPPSLQGSIIYPALFGVLDWGSVAVDPERELMFVNPTWLPTLAKLIPRAAADAAGVEPFGTKNLHNISAGSHDDSIYAQAGTPYAVKVGPFLSPLGYPCHRPPWGAAAVVDLRTQRILWQRPLGTTRDVAPLGLPLPTGVFSIGGAVMTRGGVAFIGAAIDNYLRAFDVATGRELWKGRLPAGGQANPMTYISERSGRQYVVISAGGHAPLNTTPGDYVVAYALPQPHE